MQSCSLDFHSFARLVKQKQTMVNFLKTLFGGGIVVATLLICSCRGHKSVAAKPNPLTGAIYSSAELFPVRIGQQWNMVNSFGDITHFSIEAAPSDAACETAGEKVLLHITKNHQRTYWGLMTEGAEDREVLLHDSDGSWRGLSDMARASGFFPWDHVHHSVTIDWRPLAGQPLPYVIVPSSFVQGQSIRMDTHYHSFMSFDRNTTNCIADRSTDAGRIHWVSVFYDGQVDTPAYKGWALINDQIEGCCTHEKWYWAPGIGLVQIDSIVTDRLMKPLVQAAYGTNIVTIRRID
jgi:hypothetical protein